MINAGDCCPCVTSCWISYTFTFLEEFTGALPDHHKCQVDPAANVILDRVCPECKNWCCDWTYYLTVTKRLTGGILVPGQTVRRFLASASGADVFCNGVLSHYELTTKDHPVGFDPGIPLSDQLTFPTPAVTEVLTATRSYNLIHPKCGDADWFADYSAYRPGRPK